jgi:WD40 repeat protein
MVRVRDLETGDLLHTFERPDWVWSVAIGPDGDLTAGGDEDGAIEVWRVKTGELLQTIAAHPAPVLSIALSTDGQLLFSGSADRKIKVWNPRTGELLNILSGHSKGVGSVAVSPDGQLLASGGHDGTIKIWRKAAIEGSSTSGLEEEQPPDRPSPPRTRSLPDEPEPAPEKPQYLPD